jgi:hypothetical protein
MTAFELKVTLIAMTLILAFVIVNGPPKVSFQKSSAPSAVSSISNYSTTNFLVYFSELSAMLYP